MCSSKSDVYLVGVSSSLCSYDGPELDSKAQHGSSSST